MVAAGLQASLRTHALHPSSDLEALISSVNRWVFESSPAHFFASLFYAEYQPASRLLRYVNAGHSPPIVLRRNHGQRRLLPLTPESPPVGVLEDSPYTSTIFQLERGDVLVAYTDGVIEAENSDGAAFGQERLERSLSDCGCRDPHDILQLIVDELSAYSDGPQADDITLVVMQVQPPAAAS
jgi:sigma-B regulation protein RsbU (phosphoserine phosphatase)